MHCLNSPCLYSSTTESEFPCHEDQHGYRPGRSLTAFADKGSILFPVAWTSVPAVQRIAPITVLPLTGVHHHATPNVSQCVTPQSFQTTVFPVFCTPPGLTLAQPACQHSSWFDDWSLASASCTHGRSNPGLHCLTVPAARLGLAKLAQTTRFYHTNGAVARPRAAAKRGQLGWSRCSRCASVCDGSGKAAAEPQL